MRPNWFIAFPARSRGWLAELVPDPPLGLRRFHPRDLHFTLAFLGGVDEEQARAGWQALGPMGAFDITLGEVVPMGDPRRYSALSALVVEGREPLEAAISSLRGPCLEAAGRPPERRSAEAHLTIARPMRKATGGQRRAGLRWAAALELGGVHLRLDRVCLYTWSEERRERLFRVVEERRLRALVSP